MGSMIARIRSRYKVKNRLIRSIYWKKKMKEIFYVEDVNRDGYLTIEELIKNTKPLQKYCNAPPEKMANLEKAYHLFWGEVGLRPGKKVNKKMFLSGLNRLGRKELEREQAGKATLHSHIANALFDIIDQNNNNKLQKEEIANWMGAAGLDQSEAERLFDEADHLKKGYISREELIETEFCSFFHPEKCMQKLGMTVVKGLWL
uniref:Putative photoprotein-like protein n=2 Tax=unclassified Ctenophora (in: comb jellies) TaxID=1303914 RepID=A0A0A0RVS4_9METZ|nr:putative photoprotein-like protein [Ctenophora sp. N1 WRF-2014]AIW06419.1 putative photoprotein-like protein [Ctenophora sp. N2 WRF-2014]